MHSEAKMTWTHFPCLVLWIVLTISKLCAIPAEACTMMNDGWRPKSLENRTILAQVVIAGTVLRIRDRALTPPGGSGVYSAEVAVDEVYKGYPFFNKVSPLKYPASGGGKAYIIGGFGSRERCLAEVSPGQKYIMFLTAIPVTNGREGDGMRLLARYDDIHVFGAVVDFDESHERRVHQVVGWREWAPWSPCQVTCGGGVQLRRRMCVQDVPDACEGAAEQDRQCNSFQCRDAKDLLEFMSLSSFPRGVRRVPRRRAYHISSDAVLKVPISTVYPDGFPEEFAILLVVKPPRSFSNQQNGYLYAMLVTGPDGGVQLGVQLSSSPALVYSRRDQVTGKIRLHAVSFSEYPLLKRKWNVLAFGVRRDSVTMYAECTKEFREDLEEDAEIQVESGAGDISIGNPKPNMIDMYFEGDLEQLTLIDDPDAAALQCSSPVRTFLSDSVWPSVNITNDLQGDMDTPLFLPIPDTKPKPEIPESEPPITKEDPPTTPTAQPDLVATTNHGGSNDEEAPERGLVSHTTEPSEGQTTTAVPFYNENDFDFHIEIFYNQFPNLGDIPSSPIYKVPQGIIFDGGNDVIHMEGTESSDVPTTTLEMAPTTENVNFRSTEMSFDDTVTLKTSSKVFTSGTVTHLRDKLTSDTPTIPTTEFTTDSTTEFTKTPTTVPTTIPIAITTNVPTTVPTTAPATVPTTVSTPLPTTVTTAAPSTTQVTETTAETPTIKLRLESAYRPDSFETGHRPSKQGSAALENWSTWSTCSRTCGTGTRYRFARCRPGSRLRDCKTGRGIAAQTQTCRLDDCRVPSLQWSAWSMCSRTCGDGVEMRMAYCYDNKVPGCENGQKIVVERRLCRQRHCFDVCKPSCKNGGVCLPDKKKCACPSGYLGASCEIELCSHPCQNGGQCVAKNYCQCPAGYAPPRCTPICNPRCQNGGTCKAPFECACPAAFTGKTCGQAACVQPCQNGGTCTGPNTCSCPAGYRGQHCEQSICSPACENGGTCVRPGFCRCPPAYRGSTCQIAYCRVTCRNGGRCSGPDTCTCAAGFGGAFCQRRTHILRHVPVANRPNAPLPPDLVRAKPAHSRRHHCKLRTVLVSYQRSYVKPVAKTVQVKCGFWQPLICTQTRMGYETAYRTFYRAANRRECTSNEQ